MTSSVRVVRVEEIDQHRPWGFFDVSYQEQQLTCGGGGFLFTSPTHSFHISAGLGRGSNNFAELMALKLFLLFVVEQDFHYLQVFCQFNDCD